MTGKRDTEQEFLLISKIISFRSVSPNSHCSDLKNRPLMEKRFTLGLYFTNIPHKFQHWSADISLSLSLSDILSDLFSWKCWEYGIQVTSLSLCPTQCLLLCRLKNAMLMFELAGINVLMMDYRGYGKSTGTPTETGLNSDADAVLEYASNHKRYGERSEIVLA